MHNFLVQMFTWWNGATVATRFHTWRHGTRVGEDEFGNVYYKGGSDSEGRTRRWVIYSGLAEASSIPAGWHGWMHHRTDVSPADMTYAPKEWQKQHLANRTGTPEAYRPPGSQLNPETRPTVTGDYDAWTPGS